MSIVPATLPITSSTPTAFKLTMAPVAFTEHRDLVLETPGLNVGSHVKIHVAKTI